MTLLELNRELLNEQSEYEVKTKEYDEYCKGYQQRIKSINDNIRLLDQNINIDKFELGLKILKIEFPFSKNYSTQEKTYSMIYDDLVQYAKKDLVNGCEHLSKKYIGQKRYEGFDQRTDCEYGLSPSHGYIYQRIGLKNPKQELSDYEIECCLYLLGNLKALLENINNR